jgi:hypothetical protein
MHVSLRIVGDVDGAAAAVLPPLLLFVEVST